MSARTAAGTGFTTIRSVGAALPADVLTKVVIGTDLPGLTADAYRLELGLTPREAANRAWAVLTPAWRAYKAAVDALSPTDRATGLTRDKWLAVLLRELGFGRLRSAPAGGLRADDRLFPISHLYDTGSGLDVPLHLLGWNVELDCRTAGVPGAAERAPHALVQEYLNRSDGALWALLSNGHSLRLLRDSSTLIGQSYVEFDLATMFDGEVFSDFVVLFLTCHETRFGVVSAEQTTPKPSKSTKNSKPVQGTLAQGEPDADLEAVDKATALTDCWLERWRTYATETGTRALKALSPGVAKAIESLGTGFVRQPGNTIHMRLAAKEIRLEDYHHALLRLVYRLLFCFVAEDRQVLLDPMADSHVRERYATWFSTARLRTIARRRRGTRHTDMYDAVRIVIDGLGREGGRPELGLPGIGGLFVDGPVDELLSDQRLSNEALLEATRHLTVVQPIDGGPKRVIDYRNLGAEELGSVYESLLELIPRYDANTRTFTLANIAGNDRKTTGSYYTPTSLIDCLLNSALDPLLDEAERSRDPEAALLALTVCDPACGSGHFLVAAARRLAARLAQVRSPHSEPTPVDEQRAMHDVVEHCIYGVDLNPLAAELAKVSLWLESVQPGRPLSFISAHIKVGNSLLGTTPVLLGSGIPDAAFTALAGDDKKHVGVLRKRNRAERSGQGELFSVAVIPVSNTLLAARLAQLESAPLRSLAELQLAETRLRDLEHSPELRRARDTADTWCAAFVALKAPGAPEITQAALESAAHAPLPATLDLSAIDGLDVLATGAQRTVRDLARRYRFFHWHLEFPQIFTVPDSGPANTNTGWTGGFSCVLGNPPWERIKLQEQEFFAARDPAIAEAPNAAARKALINALIDANPALHRELRDAARRAEGESALLRLSGRYPLCGRGDINTYAVFAEANRNVLHPNGRLGIIVPTGIATDATTQHYFKDLVTTGSLASLFDFENARPLFEGVHRSFKFCLLTLTGSERPEPSAKFAFFMHHPDDLADPEAKFALSPEELLLLNPNTGTSPVFRSRRDAELTLAMYRRLPILIRDGDPDGNPWGLSFMRMIDMSNDSALFRTREQLSDEGWTLTGNVFSRTAGGPVPERMQALYEGKMIHHYDHRWATYDGSDVRDMTEGEHEDPDVVALPRYWVSESEVDARLAGRWDKDWILGFRDICRSTDERTMIAGFLPRTAVGNNLPLTIVSEREPHLLGSALMSMVLDYVARISVGGTHMNFFIAEQLPLPAPRAYSLPCDWDQALSLGEWISRRILELTYTSRDMSGFARYLGDAGPPFRWDPLRRAQLRAELDACYFYIYGLSLDDAAYVLDTFPIVRRRDEAAVGEYRTKRLVLDAFAAMERAVDTRTVYVSPCGPPAGDGPRHERRDSVAR